jgi:hypothetical protein
MCKGQQWNPGRKLFLSLFKEKMYGIWMKPPYFGVLYQIADLARRVVAVNEGEKTILHVSIR